MLVSWRVYIWLKQVYLSGIHTIFLNCEQDSELLTNVDIYKKNYNFMALNKFMFFNEFHT